jgi:integrase
MRWIDHNPALALDPIVPGDKKTQPLTPAQFEELLAATEQYDAIQRREIDKFGRQLKTIFLVMRWTGLRVQDVLKLPRSALRGNALSLTTRKTIVPVVLRLPDHVVSALNSMPRRAPVHADYFWWSRTCASQSLTSVWVARIRAFSKLLSFKDDHGQPMTFRSHMLRDTFAVEMLLAGVPLEDVSRLLTHKSVRITEKYYAPWVKARQQQLEDKAVAAMQKMGATFSVTWA